jgi:hypothetical protein
MRKRVVNLDRAKAYRRLLENYRDTNSLETGQKMSVDELRNKFGMVKQEFRYNKPSYFKDLDILVLPNKKTMERLETKKLNKTFYGFGLNKAAMGYSPENKMMIIPSAKLDKYSVRSSGDISHELRHHAQNIGVIKRGTWKRESSTNIPIAPILKPIIKFAHKGADLKSKEIDAYNYGFGITRKMIKRRK